MGVGGGLLLFIVAHRRLVGAALELKRVLEQWEVVVGDLGQHASLLPCLGVERVVAVLMVLLEHAADRSSRVGVLLRRLPPLLLEAPAEGGGGGVCAGHRLGAAGCETIDCDGDAGGDRRLLMGACGGLRLGELDRNTSLLSSSVARHIRHRLLLLRPAGGREGADCVVVVNV